MSDRGARMIAFAVVFLSGGILLGLGVVAKAIRVEAEGSHVAMVLGGVTLIFGGVKLFDELRASAKEKATRTEPEVPEVR